MKIATLVMVSALFGAGGVVVKDQVQEARRQEILLAEVAADQRLAAMELDLLRSRVEEAEGMYEDGLASEETVRNVRLRLQEVEVRVSRLWLDEEEIRLTGREPDNGLAAPPTGGRDFVTERLSLELSVVGAQREAVRENLTRLRELRGQGLVDEEAVSRARAEEERLDVSLMGLSERIGLRKMILSGEISGQEAENLMEVREIRMELAMLQPLRRDAMIRLSRAEEMVDDDLAPESYLQEARLQVMELETRLELLQLKLEILGGGNG